jgi:hypothetical protein
MLLHTVSLASPSQIEPESLSLSLSFLFFFSSSSLQLILQFEQLPPIPRVVVLASTDEPDFLHKANRQTISAPSTTATSNTTSSTVAPSSHHHHNRIKL